MALRIEWHPEAQQELIAMLGYVYSTKRSFATKDDLQSYEGKRSAVNRYEEQPTAVTKTKMRRCRYGDFLLKKLQYKIYFVFLQRKLMHENGKIVRLLS